MSNARKFVLSSIARTFAAFHSVRGSSNVVLTSGSSFERGVCWLIGTMNTPINTHVKACACIHAASGRACGALRLDLARNLLFGHQRGLRQDARDEAPPHATACVLLQDTDTSQEFGE